MPEGLDKDGIICAGLENLIVVVLCVHIILDQRSVHFRPTSLSTLHTLAYQTRRRAKSRARRDPHASGNVILILQVSPCWRFPPASSVAAPSYDFARTHPYSTG